MIARRLRVRDTAAEQVRARLIDLAPSGWEERETAGAFELVFYGEASALPDVEALRAAAGDVLLGLADETIPGNWEERWKRWHRPVDVRARGRQLHVRPPWEPAVPGALDLVVDPGQAFGTGGHATTRLCLELLLDIEPGGPLADWGCGSGVLALAGARLGYAPVRAVDFDPESVAATRANAERNGIAGLRVEQADLTRTPGPPGRVVLANLLRPLLLEVAQRLDEVPEHLILSGLLRGQGDEVAHAFSRHGLAEAARHEEGEWCALLLRAG